MEKDDLVQDGLKEMEEVLKRADLGRIALSDGSLPYVVPLNFIYDKGKISFHCAWEGKKLDLIQNNPNCCFEVDEFMGKVSYHYDIKCHLDYDSVLVCGKVALNAMKPNGYAYSSSWARNMMSDIENPYRKEV